MENSSRDGNTRPPYLPLEKEAIIRTGHGTIDWFQIGKGVHQSCVYCHPAYLTYMPSTSWEMPGRMKHKLESRLLEEKSITSDTQMTPPLWQKAKKNWRGSWWNWKRRVKNLAYLSIQKTKITASGPITSWKIDGGKKNGTSERLSFLGSKITADGDCSLEIKRCLLLSRKVITKLDCIL